MKILVISDSHGRRLNVLDTYKKENPDGVLFLGDGLSDMDVLDVIPPKFCVCVKGNCDIFPEEGVRVLHLENKKLLLTHGHGSGVKQGLWKLDLLAQERGADVVLYGHTHQPADDSIEGRRYICPGSIAQGTYVILSLEKDELKVEFKELY